jgi:hypothetical protein
MIFEKLLFLLLGSLLGRAYKREKERKCLLAPWIIIVRNGIKWVKI